MAQKLRFMIIGDLIGDPGLRVFQKWSSKLKEKHKVDAIIVNGENTSKNGCGVTAKAITSLKHNGVSVITLGNHAFDWKDVYNILNERDDIVRPANYPSECPGKGHCFFNVGEHRIAVVNLHGRVFVKDLLDCPFKTIESQLLFLRSKTNIILVDFHAEATSEKKAMGLFLDGKVSTVFGTHTHVQTSDEQILPSGTSYITDIGFCGAQHSVIGMEFKNGLRRLMIHPKFGKFVVEKKGPIVVNGALVDVDVETGKTIAIERINFIDEDIGHTFEDIDNKKK